MVGTPGFGQGELWSAEEAPPASGARGPLFKNTEVRVGSPHAVVLYMMSSWVTPGGESKAATFSTVASMRTVSVMSRTTVTQGGAGGNQDHGEPGALPPLIRTVFSCGTKSGSATGMYAQATLLVS